MAAKRRPTSDLNHENWDKEEKPEDQGVFKAAPEDELKTRVIKKARRKMPEPETGKGDSEVKSAFSSFAGFGKVSPSVNLSNMATSSFSFLSKITTPASTLDIKKDSKEDAKEKIGSPTNSNTNYNFQNSNTYYARLKNLNQEVSNWIKTHVDENPICILSPIFKDYEKYLKEIQDNEKNAKPDEKGSNKMESNLGGNIPIASSTMLSSFKFSTDSGTKQPSDTTKKSEESKTVFVIDKKNDKLSEKPSIFGSAGSSNIFASSSTGFSFGDQPKTDTPVTSSGFSFTNSKPFTFGNVAKPQTSDIGENGGGEEGEDEDEPPKVEVKLVVEEGNVYSKRCKVFVKSDSNYNDRGVGTLYVKPIVDSEKYQLLVRADTNLGNILLNTILSDAIPVQRMGKNNVMLVCIPNPEGDLKKAVPTLLRVKTAEEADELMETINKYKK